MKITRGPVRVIKKTDVLRVMLSFGQTRRDATEIFSRIGSYLPSWIVLERHPRLPDFVVVVSFPLSLSLTSVSPRVSLPRPPLSLRHASPFRIIVPP